MSQNADEYEALTATLLSFTIFRHQFEHIIKPRLIKFRAMTEKELSSMVRSAHRGVKTVYQE